MTQVVARQLPPPLRQRSRVSESASQWGPTLITIAAMGFGAFKFNEQALENIKQLQAATEALKDELKSSRESQAAIGAKLDEFYENEKVYRQFVDGSLCRLDVKVPTGCPNIEYGAEPMAKSKAPRIQPKVEVKVLK